MPKMKTFSFVRAGTALFFAVLCMLGNGAAVAQGYPVVVPASSSGAASRAIVTINQADIYNNIANAYNTANYAVGVGSNAQNTANYAVNVGSAAQNTANWAVNIGSAAQGTADSAIARIGQGGSTIVKAGNVFAGGSAGSFEFLCLTPPYNGENSYQLLEMMGVCPAGSKVFVTRGNTGPDLP